MAKRKQETQHYFANDGSDWKTQPSPVDSNEARAADVKVDEQAVKGDGFTAPNETQLQRTSVENAGGKNAAADA